MTPATPHTQTPPARPRSTLTLVLLGLIAFIVFATTCALGVWQVQRLAWKTDLIERIESRVHQPAVPAPLAPQWSALTADNAEYRHVTVTGEYQYDRQTLVQAVSDLGGGYWVMTPLRLADGSTILVNRGFVLPQWRKSADTSSGPGGPVKVTGLLRMGEPSVMFLRDNDPAADRWYTRDLPAIAAKRGLGDVAPYFIDADAQSAGNNRDPAIAPVGGLTVISFPNNHLGYALTWFALAAMVLIAVVIVAREEKRRRRQNT
ncbi:SURF1 family protein [Bordetella sp. 15P40C-2]|uniref:SURF1 family protein n=1 Tax=Bordetella sp. 15P40C-2 TaxID=2572246 RepID=UPI0013287248|nr:SURF1 family protein [Bordetella sp. 15P40C-2]MVW71276.1 SURF1 family protein [Bordetella sp. 15P40C-2]